MFQWSNPAVKDHLALFTHGAVGQWSVPRTTGQDYFDQMTAGGPQGKGRHAAGRRWSGFRNAVTTTIWIASSMAHGSDRHGVGEGDGGGARGG